MKRNWHEVTQNKSHVSKEKLKAKELKNSNWWKQKLADGICHYCGKKFQPQELTMDHIVPIARGGKSVKGNVVVCCFSCNQSKGLDTPVEAILDKIIKKEK